MSLRKTKKPSLAKTNKPLACQWHPTKNAPLTPWDVTAGSHKKIWWVCSKGHEWQAPLYCRSDGTGCPYCAGMTAAKDNCLLTQNPGLARQWHPTKNEPLTPHDVTAGSGKKAWWVCKKGHTWQGVINHRNRGAGCPFCAHKQASKENCLQTINPQLAKQWHPTKNAPLTPKKITPYSRKKVWWRCDKGHEWETLIRSRHNYATGCPYCKGRRANKENCLAAVNRKLAREWHPTKNAPLTPRDVTAGAGKKVWWRCSKGHEWQTVVYSRSAGVGCPYCSGHFVCKDNCLHTVKPAFAKEWHPTKNAPLTAADVTLHSNKIAWWLCRKGHEWKASVNVRSMGVGCPYCRERRVSQANCLQTLSPWLAREWHPTKNRSWTPRDVSPFSKRLVWWKCRKGHEAQERVLDRYRRGGCPVCTLKARAPRLFEATEDRGQVKD